MLEQIPDTNVIRIVSDGEWSREDVMTATCELRSFIDSHGEITVLEHVLPTGRSYTRLLWDEIAAESDCIDSVTHVAVIGDMECIDVFSAVFRDSESADIRSFAESEFENAVFWLKNAATFDRISGLHSIPATQRPRAASHCVIN